MGRVLADEGVRLVERGFGLAAAVVGVDEIEAGLAPDITIMRRDFEAAHLARFGFNDPAKSLVIEALSIEAVGGAARIHPVPHTLTISPLPAPVTTRRLFSQGKAHQAKIFRREQLAPGHRLFGPALVIEDHQTIVVEDPIHGPKRALLSN